MLASRLKCSLVCDWYFVLVLCCTARHGPSTGCYLCVARHAPTLEIKTTVMLALWPCRRVGWSVSFLQLLPEISVPSTLSTCGPQLSTCGPRVICLPVAPSGLPVAPSGLPVAPSGLPVAPRVICLPVAPGLPVTPATDRGRLHNERRNPNPLVWTKNP